MAKGVPQSFQDLKSRVKNRLQNGSNDVQKDVIEMGDAMMQSNVEAKSPEDRLAKRVWQASNHKDKEMLANMVTNMAKDEEDLS